MFLISTIKLSLFIIIGILIILIILKIILIIRSNYKEKRMKEDVYNLIKKIAEDRKLGNFILKPSEEADYDFYFESRTHIYFIKLIKNYGNYEICVNNQTKWQIKKSINDHSFTFVNGVENLMFKEIKFDSKKIIKKLFIIYPNSINLLKYINECEMTFIYSNTDVYGANIITYQNMLDHPELFEAK